MILSVDKGYGLDKFAYRDGGDIKFGKMISAVAEASDDAEDAVEFEGRKYYLGEEALMEDSEKIKPMLEYKEMEVFTPLSIWSIAKEIGVPAKEIERLAIGLSLAQKDYAKSFVQRLSKFKVEGEVFDFKNRITLVPQGIGAKYAIDHFFYDENHNESFAILDIGQLTVDTVVVVKGKVRKENASGEAHEGVIKIINELKEFIAQESDNHEILSVKEVQEALLNGSVVLFGEEIDLRSKIEDLKKEYTKYLIHNLEQKHRNIFKKFPKIYIVGGGAYYLDEETLKNHKVLGRVSVIPENAEYYNAIGNLIVAESQSGKGS